MNTMTILKTDLSLFENIAGWDFEENFVTVSSEFGNINIHYVDENSESNDVVLLMHGNPTWGYLYSCLLYTSPSPRDKRQSRMPSSA